jgi:phosphate-selective porin OprO/OprP
MNRAMMLSLLFAVGAVVAARAEPPTPPPTVPGPVPTGPSAESPPGTPAEKPKEAEPKAADGKKEEAKSEKKDSPSTSPKNPLEDLLNPKPTFQVRGRIEAEAVMAAQSPQSKATLGDLQNGYGFRRVRLGAQGTIGDSSSWVSEVELAGGNVRLRDVFVGLDALPGVRQVRVGHFREPYSLEGMTSSNFITFLERSPVNVLAPARNWGVCGYCWPDDERVLFSLGVFRDGTLSSGQSIGDGDNWAYTARLTGLPVYEPNEHAFRLVHVGGAFSQRVPPNGVITFTPRNVSNLLTVDDNPGSPFLPVVDIPANSYQLYNLQAAGVCGPFSLQGEWTAAAVQQTNAGLVFVHGFYIDGSYFLTGEHRGYNRTRGSFDQVAVLRPLIRSRTDPRRGCGAVEVAAQYSYLNFDSPNLPLDVNGMPAGTLLHQLTLGTNWYLNSFTRIMFNYTAGFPDKVGFGPTVAHIFGLRTAIFW